MSKAPLYVIIYEDNTSFSGGDYNDTKWLDAPKKKIKRIMYYVDKGYYFTIAGHDTYFHMIEASKEIHPSGKGGQKLEYAHIMGKKGGQVEDFRISLRKTNKRNKGQIFLDRYNEDDRFIKGLNKDGWK